jgi:small multidrug resistance pump
MSSKRIAVSLTLLLSIIGVVGDICVKRAAVGQTANARYFVGGLAVYAATAFGWLLVMRVMKLADVGATYAVATTTFSAVAGMVFFGERLSMREVAGTALAIVSIVLIAGGDPEVG